MNQDFVILDEEDKYVTFADVVNIIDEDDCKETVDDELHEVQEALDDVKEEITMNEIEKQMLEQHHKELMKRLDKILIEMGIIK